MEPSDAQSIPDVLRRLKTLAWPEGGDRVDASRLFYALYARATSVAEGHGMRRAGEDRGRGDQVTSNREINERIT